MIIFGTRAAKGEFLVTPIRCPFCEKENSVGALPYHKYIHVYWIPLFPTNKEYIVACEACGHQIPLEEIESSDLIEIRKNTSTPIWMYTGLIIIALFVLYLMIHDFIN